MSRDDDPSITLILVFAALFVCLIGGVAVHGLRVEVKQLQHEAIKRNYATWTNDGEGNPVFTWKEPAQ